MLHNFTIEARYADGQFRGRAVVPATDPYDALTQIVGRRTWANGYTDFASGVAWPFNPEMTIDGVRAADVFAEKVAGAAKVAA